MNRDNVLILQPFECLVACWSFSSDFFCFFVSMLSVRVWSVIAINGH